MFVSKIFIVLSIAISRLGLSKSSNDSFIFRGQNTEWYKYDLFFLKDEYRDYYESGNVALKSRSSFELSQENTLPFHAFKSFGTAYVITAEALMPQAAADAAIACGFDPILVPAIIPELSDYYSPEQFASNCLFSSKPVTIPRDIGLADVAAICSHRRAIKYIAMSDIADEDWALVLEGDVSLHPSLDQHSSLSRIRPREYIAEAIINQKLNYAYGFLYLGTCFPSCTSTMSAQSCHGNCSFAYAITKNRAYTIFEEIYCREARHRKKAPCGFHKPHNLIGQSFAQHFEMPIRSAWDRKHSPRAVILGIDLKSPHDSNTVGLLYSKTTLEARLANNSSKLKKTDPACFTLRFDGRMGNILFEYASLIGICAFRGFDYRTCAALPPSSITGDRQDLPMEEFKRVFKLRETYCAPVYNETSNTLLTYHENQDMNPPQHKYIAVKFDKKVLEQPPGTMLDGFLQSYKYFHPHAEKYVKNTFQFSDFVKISGELFLSVVYEKLNDNLRTKNLTCVHVRRGDKARSWNKGKSSVYDPWAISLEYYVKAISYVRQWNSDLNLIYFVGGGFSRKEYSEDRFFVRERLMSRAYEGDVVTLAPDELNHMSVQYILTRCDHLIISSSTFSWWAGYLSEKASIIVAPKNLFVPSIPFAPGDHYPPGWVLIDKDSPDYNANQSIHRPYIKPWQF